jgi:hypothetical protein
LRSGKYDILLIVDAMEVSGGNQGGHKSRKQLTIDELTALKVGSGFESRKDASFLGKT